MGKETPDQPSTLDILKCWNATPICKFRYPRIFMKG